MNDYDTPTPNSVGSKKSSFDSLNVIAPSEPQSLVVNVPQKHRHDSTTKKKVSFDKVSVSKNDATQKSSTLSNLLVLKRPISRSRKYTTSKSRIIGSTKSLISRQTARKGQVTDVTEQPLVWLSNGTRPFTRRKEVLEQLSQELQSPAPAGKSFFAIRSQPKSTTKSRELESNKPSARISGSSSAEKLRKGLISPRPATASKSLDSASEYTKEEFRTLTKNNQEAKAHIVRAANNVVTNNVKKPGGAQQKTPFNHVAAARAAYQNRAGRQLGGRTTGYASTLSRLTNQTSGKEVPGSLKTSNKNARLNSAKDRQSRSEMLVSHLLSPTPSHRSQSNVSSNRQSNMSLTVMVSSNRTSKITTQHPSSTKAAASTTSSRVIPKPRPSTRGVIKKLSSAAKRSTTRKTANRKGRKKSQIYGWNDEHENNNNNEKSSSSDSGDEEKPAASNKSGKASIERSYLTGQKLKIHQAKGLIKSCESYMNWCKGFLRKDKYEDYIQKIKSRFLEPPPKGEFVMEEVLHYNEFEFYSSLGALCFFQIELKKFEDACITIKHTQKFVSQAVQAGFLRRDYIYSFDYVWDLLRMYGTVVEFRKTKHLTYFQQMDMTAFPSFASLASVVKAGVYGLKANFYALVGFRLEKIVETLRAAIFLDNDNYDWHLLLSRALRCSRRNHVKIAIKPVGIEEEIQAVSKATELFPSNPRCVLAAMQAVLDMAIEQEKRSSWHVFQFGHRRKFYHMANVAKFLRDQALIVLRHAPRSIDLNMALVEIFACILTPPRRDLNFSKECLERCQRNYPRCSRVYGYLGLFYLLTEHSYKQAEVYFDTAFAIDSTNFMALKHLLLLMMRTLVIRQTGILEVTKAQLRSAAWDRKQKGTLHFLRGLTFLALSKPPEGFEEFFEAKKLSVSSLAFNDLPEYHRIYGWSGWPSRTLLSYGNIRLEAQVYAENELDESDVDKRLFIHALVEQLGRIEEEEMRCRTAIQRQSSKKNLTEDERSTKSFFYSTKLSFLEE